MRLVTRSTLLAMICVSLLASDDAFAQVSIPGVNGALRERGIRSRLGARLEARQERVNRAAPARPPIPGPVAGPNAAAARGPQAGAGLPNASVPNAGVPGAGLPEGAQAEGQRTAADEPFGGGLADSIHSAQYVAPGGANADAGVASGATALPPNRLPYTGRGVSLRLPADLGGEVNYLVDDAQPMRIEAGEEQRLQAKGRYEIRFSRGVDDSGRSYGEARYAVTEGAYHFAVSANGWELYRDPDSPNALQARLPERLQQEGLQQEGLQQATLQAEARTDVPEPQQAVVPDPLEPSDLSELRRRAPLPAADAGEQVPHADAETLPSPTPTLRSILERE